MKVPKGMSRCELTAAYIQMAKEKDSYIEIGDKRGRFYERCRIMKIIEKWKKKDYFLLEDMIKEIEEAD